MSRPPFVEPFGAWSAALEALARLIAHALRAAGEAKPADPFDAFRGLTIAADDVVRLLGASPASHLLDGSVDDPVTMLVAPLMLEPRLAWLRETFQLDDFEVAVIALAMAPELDLRFERLYAFLQDDIAKRQVRVDLCIGLLSRSPDERLDRIAQFEGDAPLVRHRLVEVVRDSHHDASSALNRIVRVDPQLAHFLLYRDALDARIEPFCRVIHPHRALEDAPLTCALRDELRARADHAADHRAALRLYLRTSDPLQARQVAEALASRYDRRVLECDLGRLLHEPEPRRAMQRIFREAWFRSLVVHLHFVDAAIAEAIPVLGDALALELAHAPGVVIVSGDVEWRSLETAAGHLVRIDAGVLDAPGREECWRCCVREAGLEADDESLAMLARRFRLGPSHIEHAVAAAREAPEGLASKDREGLRRQLFAAAREQSGQRLRDLAQRIKPRHTWQELVLPPDCIAQLREVCGRVSARARVFDTWGFEQRLSLGKGTTVLFAGPSGTGKTMTAEIIANELGLDLYKINLAHVVSKYIGETEKNLDRVFEAAHDADAVLLFDEAEALFGKRSEVRDAHDRYANVEVAYLLQRMEAFEGLAILSTNLRQNMDEAFTRRLAATVHFPFPEVAERRRIWAGIWPPELPLASDVDVEALAQRFKLSGGHIKNIALAAAFLAAQEPGSVTMGHVLHATRREFQKQGKSLTDAELAVPELRVVS